MGLPGENADNDRNLDNDELVEIADETSSDEDQVETGGDHDMDLDQDWDRDSEESESSDEEESFSALDEPWELHGTSDIVQIEDHSLYWLDGSTLHVFEITLWNTWSLEASYPLESLVSRKSFGGSAAPTLLVDDGKLIVSTHDHLGFYTFSELAPQPQLVTSFDREIIPDTWTNLSNVFSVRDGLLFWLVQGLSNENLLHVENNVIVDLHDMKNLRIVDTVNDQINVGWYSHIERSSLLLHGDQLAIQYIHRYDLSSDANFDLWKLFQFDDDGKPFPIGTLENVEICCGEPDSQVRIDGDRLLILWYPTNISFFKRMTLLDISDPTSFDILFSEGFDEGVDWEWPYDWPLESTQLRGDRLWAVNKSQKTFCAATFDDQWQPGPGNCVSFHLPDEREFVQYVDGDDLYILFPGDRPSIRKESLEDWFQTLEESSLQ